MIIDQRIALDAPPDRAWDLLMDLPEVGRCVPGVESVTLAENGRYRGILKFNVGPIRLHLEGEVWIAARDRATWTAQLEARASDRRIGGAVNATMRMRLHPTADGRVDLAVLTDAAVLGKIGQFGQAVVKRKADALIAEFVRNVSNALRTPTT